MKIHMDYLEGKIE